MADNRSRIESVRRELRAIARFDAQKIHESSSATTLYNQPSSRPVLEEPHFTSPSKSSELASKSRVFLDEVSSFQRRANALMKKYGVEQPSHAAAASSSWHSEYHAPAAASSWHSDSHADAGDAATFSGRIKLLSPAPSPMKPLPSPSRASVTAGGGVAHFDRTDQGYNPAVYAGNMPQTATSSSFRSLPSASAGSFHNQLALHQLQDRDSDIEQHFDYMLQAEHMPMSLEQQRPASPVAVSQAETTALKLELQQQTGRVAQLQQQLKALQARRPSPERTAASNQPPPQLRTAADIAAHEEVRALQAALASAHARNDVLERELHHARDLQSASQLECEELSRGFSDALSQIEHERAQCAMHQRRVNEVEALLHAAQHGMTALKELASPDSKRSEALASQLHAAQARERALAAELKQLQQTVIELQQKQQEPEFPDEDVDREGKRQRVRLRLQRVARDVGDLNLLLKNLSEGKNVPMALLVQDKRHSSEADFSDADEEELLSALSASAASMLHLVRERVADSIGQQCSTQ